MTEVAETFVVTLARASKLASKYMRGLSKDDRDDVLSTAILWCWENRATYNVETSLEKWFVGAVRNALQKWELGEARETAELVDGLIAQDDTSAKAEVLEAVENLMWALSPAEQRVAIMECEGRSRLEMVALGVKERTIRSTRLKLKELRDLIPGNEEFKHPEHTASKQSSDDSSAFTTPIDQAIERLEFGPLIGRECPPCWRCKWFDGFMPTGRIRSLMVPIMEADVRAAVSNVEARKLEIAARVRAGTIWRLV